MTDIDISDLNITINWNEMVELYKDIKSKNAKLGVNIDDDPLFYTGEDETLCVIQMKVSIFNNIVELYVMPSYTKNSIDDIKGKLATIEFTSKTYKNIFIEWYLHHRKEFITMLIDYFERELQSLCDCMTDE